MLLAGGQTRPRHLNQPVGVVEQAQGDRHQVVDAVRSDDLHGVAAARLGQQGVDGHHQGVGTVLVVIVTSTGAWSQAPVAVGSVGFTSTVMVGVLLELPRRWGVVATVPTEEMTPGVV